MLCLTLLLSLLCREREKGSLLVRSLGNLHTLKEVRNIDSWISRYFMLGLTSESIKPSEYKIL